MIVEFVKDQGFVYYCEQDGDLSGEYVGLSDYTALAAEHEQLREAYQKLITSRAAALAAENERLREALWDAYGFLVNLYCHDSNYPEVKRFLDKIEAVMPEVKPE